MKPVKNKKIFFLAGFPRAGNTLLTSILNQNPDICCIGNNRWLAAHELGIKEVPIKIVTSEVPKDLMAATEDYIPTEVEGLPSRARKYVH